MTVVLLLCDDNVYRDSGAAIGRQPDGSNESMIDGSYLAHDDEPVDYDTKITR